jgi:hypothetical protein
MTRNYQIFNLIEAFSECLFHPERKNKNFIDKLKKMSKNSQKNAEMKENILQSMNESIMKKLFSFLLLDSVRIYSFHPFIFGYDFNSS